ncbi:MFS transporter [Kribbella shirazensis]|uniref:Putative MFS family arabinose efflux permease n=1 Tax=Kribbella shirazensis TaxID=1105143 RepID=A0A7X6A445_9ACTN|nr:MFS transporter [Kribbella shirazensis]NIK61101.1 putative MFS family arabinose efflux permease [Kribbella shirazensis]
MYWRRIAELPAWLKAVMVGQLVNGAGALAWVYLTLYLVEDRGMSAQQAGFAAAAYGAGLIGGNLGGGWFGDRFGLRTAALGSQLLWAIACVAMPFTPGAALVVLAALAGLFGGAGRPNLSALVATSLPPERRREGIALSRTATNAGFTIGPPLGGLLATYDFSLVFVVDAVTSLVMAAIVWRWVPAARRTTRLSTTGLWKAVLSDRAVLVVLATIVVVDTVYRQIFATLPLVLRDAGTSAVWYGVLLGGSSIVIVLFEAPLAVRLRGHRATRVMAAGFACIGLGLAVVGVWPVLAGAAVAITVMTAGEMLYKPTATAHVADAAPEGMVGRYSSLYAAASISGMFLAPAIGGTTYQHAPRLLYPVAAALALAAGAVLFTRAAARDVLPSGSTAQRSSAS